MNLFIKQILYRANDVFILLFVYRIIIFISLPQIKLKKLSKMKKVLAISAFAILGVAALSSCKKDYTCDYGDGETYSYTGLSKSQATAAKSACTLGGGTWSKK